MKITPELIPHRDFHKGKWLLPTERAGWYYFAKKKNTNTITSRSFLKSVDEPLKELVQFLHIKGIKTTPSCAGHHLSERNLEKIYDDLEKDADEIKQQGLQLKDVETGKSYCYKDKHYQLPWSRDSFLQMVAEYQQKGILGIRTAHHQKAKAQILKLRVAGANIREKDSILFIHTTANGTGDSRHAWKEITHSIKNIFNQEPTMIRKLQSGEYRLYSRKINPKTGKRRNLGTFHSLEAAKKHEREIQYFKRH